MASTDDYFDCRDTPRLQPHLTTRLEALAVRVTMKALPRAA